MRTGLSDLQGEAIVIGVLVAVIILVKRTVIQQPESVLEYARRKWGHTK